MINKLQYISNSNKSGHNCSECGNRENLVGHHCSKRNIPITPIFKCHFFISKISRGIHQGRGGGVLEGVAVPRCRRRGQDRSDRHQQGQVYGRGQGTHHPFQADRRPQEAVPWIGEKLISFFNP